MDDSNENGELSENEAVGANEQNHTCGIVMPISAIDGLDEEHWVEVYDIHSEAIANAGFEPNLVSDAASSGIIHARIVRNLYSNPMVVCDVSALNPNVMLELGLRLAFDKPTVVVKDDKTDYSFDTSPIDHIEYRRDLRHQNAIDFKEKLEVKVRATYRKSQEDPNHSTFLKHFGKFEIANLGSQTVSKGEYILKELELIRSEIAALRNIPRYRAARSQGAQRAILNQMISEALPDSAIKPLEGADIENLNSPELDELLDSVVDHVYERLPVGIKELSNEGSIRWAVKMELRNRARSLNS